MLVNRYINGKKVEPQDLKNYTIQNSYVRNTLTKVQKRVNGEDRIV